MDRLSALDASFLNAETPNAHMHVGWLALISPPAGAGGIDPELLRSRIEARLDIAPRFRKRVVELPVGEPPLIDDPSFAVDRHVRVLDAPARGTSSEQLQQTLDEFLSTQLDRARPLWEIAILPRLADGRAAILGKVHHALVDGVAAVELGTLLFDLEPDTSAAEVPRWRPQLPASPIRLLIRSATDSALEQFRAAGRMANLGLRPGAGLRTADSMRRAAFAMAREVARPAPDSYLNGPIGPQRTLRTVSLPLERVLTLKARTGSKLNDVVLALASGMLHRFATTGAGDPGALRAMIPINVRGQGPAEAAGNRIAFGFVDLPVTEGDPLARLRSVRRRSAALREGQRTAGSDLIMQSLGALPGPMKALATRVASSPRTFNLTVSNVPGPRVPLYAAGGEVESIYPVIPLAGSHALAVGVLTYGSGMHVALHAEPERLPGAEALPGLFETALAELENAAAAAPPPGTPGGLARSGPRRRTPHPEPAARRPNGAGKRRRTTQP